MNRKTQELLELLEQNSYSLEQYLREQEEELLDVSPSLYLNQLLSKYHVEKGTVIRRSGLNQIYGYQIFAGTKTPGRNKVLALIFAFPLHQQDAQRLLRLWGHRELYPRLRRDSALLVGLRQGLSVPEMDDLLYELGEETLL